MRIKRILSILLAGCMMIGFGGSSTTEKVFASSIDASFGTSKVSATTNEDTERFYDELSEMISNYEPLTSNLRAASKTSSKTASKYSDYSSGRLIVKSKMSARKIAKKTKAADYIVDPDGYYILQYKSLVDTKNAHDWLKKKIKKKKVKSVEIDRLFYLYDDNAPVDNTEVNDDSHLDDAYNKSKSKVLASGTSHLSWGATRIGVDEYISASSASANKQKIVVAVIDTGVDLDHPFLSGRLVTGKNMVSSGSADDDNGHGTHVAGIITDSTQGTNVKIMPVKVLASNGIGSDITIASGINWAVSNGAKVINLSLGGYTTGTHYMDSAVQSAINSGVTVCVAAGNSYGTTNGFCPAHISAALTVAAVNSSDSIESFSNHGNAVDLACPGAGIYSSYPGGGYAYMDGTSMATPYAAACAALILTRHPDLTPAKVCNRLKKRCDDKGTTGWDMYYGEGILNMAKNVSDDDGSDDGGSNDSPSTPTNPTPSEPDDSDDSNNTPVYDDYSNWTDYDWDKYWDDSTDDDSGDSDGGLTPYYPPSIDDGYDDYDDYDGYDDYSDYYNYGSVSVSLSSGSSNGKAYATLKLTTNVNIDNITVKVDGTRVKSSKFKKVTGGYTLDLSSYGRGNHNYSVVYGWSTSSGSFSI